MHWQCLSMSGICTQGVCVRITSLTQMLVDSAPGAMHGLTAFAFLRCQLHVGGVPDMRVHAWQCQRYAMACICTPQHHLCIHCNTIYVHTIAPSIYTL